MGEFKVNHVKFRSQNLSRMTRKYVVLNSNTIDAKQQHKKP